MKRKCIYVAGAINAPSAGKYLNNLRKGIQLSKVDMINDMLSSLFQGNEVNEGDADSATYNAVLKLVDPYEITSIDSYGGDGSGGIVPIRESDITKVVNNLKKKK